MSEKTPTVYDVAAHAGVSIATVSRVLRRPDDVREATRAKVLASVRELGYLPSASARGLAARRTGVIGIFFPGFDAAWEIPALSDAEDGLVRMVRDSDDQWGQRPPDLYFDAVLRGAELEAWRRGLVLMVGVGRGADPEAVVRDIAGRVDGLVVLARSVPDEVLSSIAHRIPVTLLAGPRRGDDFDHVFGGEFGGHASPYPTPDFHPRSQRTALRGRPGRLSRRRRTLCRILRGAAPGRGRSGHRAAAAGGVSA